MGRKHVNTIMQPDENTCGPVSIVHALAIFGQKRSIVGLSKLCKTSSQGTTTHNMIQGLRKLRFFVMGVEKSRLDHLMSALQSPPNQPRAVIVSYLYANDKRDEPLIESGHWATVCSYSPSRSRIVLFDSYSGQKKSYYWEDFCLRWKDYDRKRRKISDRKYRFIKRWRQRLMLVVASERSHLPEFRIRTASVHTPLHS